MGLLTAAFFVLIGGAALVCGGEVLVRGATKIAYNLKISPLIVGLTIVAICTSAPEMAVSFSSALLSTGENASNVADVALGNVVGSNICNILLILGVCALIRPLNASRQMVRRECPTCVAISALVLILAAFNLTSSGARFLPRWSGALLLVLFVLYEYWTVRQARRPAASEDARELVEATVPTFEEFPDDKDGARDEGNEKSFADKKNVDEKSADRKSSERTSDFEISPEPVDAPVPSRWGTAIFAIFFGLFLLVVGSRLFVDGAVEIARFCGVSELTIGLTLVALGTSLPELTVSAVATVRGQIGVALGNVVGSNICNLLLVLGGTLALLPGGMTLKPQSLFVDLPVMVATAALAAWFCFTDRKIERWEGAILVAGQLAYAVYLVKFAG